MSETLTANEFKCIKDFCNEITRLEKENLNLRYDLAEAKANINTHLLDSKPHKILNKLFGGAL